MKRKKTMLSKLSKILSEREKPVIGKLSFSKEELRRSTFLNNKIEQAKHSLQQHPIPVELLR